MKTRAWPLLLAITLIGGVLLARPVASPRQPPTADRVIAVTVDDLPSAGVVANDPAALRAHTEKLLASFRAAQVPVVGFVNEGKLVVPGETAADAEARIASLKLWVDAGFELGNHTFSHRSLNTTPLDEFKADVVRGETVTRRLLQEKGRTLRYFRHPFLHVGADAVKRREFEAFLAERSYTIAPVTIDTEDYIYASVYAAALRRGDREAAAKVAAEYVRATDDVFAFAEDVARRLTGREIRHVLLLHANAINADHFGAVAAVMRKRGYRFVELKDALADEVYARPDTYVGNWGLSWLHHWEITTSGTRTPSPDPVEWVMHAYNAGKR